MPEQLSSPPTQGPAYEQSHPDIKTKGFKIRNWLLDPVQPNFYFSQGMWSQDLDVINRLEFVENSTITFIILSDIVSSRHNSSGVMGGVCKVWKIIHRNIMIYDY